jgi:hypothetical protein
MIFKNSYFEFGVEIKQNRTYEVSVCFDLVLKFNLRGDSFSDEKSLKTGGFLHILV